MQKNKTQRKLPKVKVIFDFNINSCQRIKIIEDFLLWCFERELSSDSSQVLIKYKQYLEKRYTST